VDFTASIFKRRILEGLEATGRGAGPFKMVDNGQTVDLSKLLSISGDAAFLTEAYRTILNRETDAVGFSHYSGLLRGGLARESVLRQIIKSDEARLRGLRAVGVSEGPADATAGPRFAWRRRAKLWFLERIRRIHAFTLRVFRIERIELKLDYAAAEMASLAERQSSRMDGALAIISEKLDRHVADLDARQLQMVEEWGRRQAGERQSMQAEITMLRQRLELLTQKLSTPQRPPVFAAGESIVATEVDGFILGIPADEWRLAAYYALRGVPEPGMVKVFQAMVTPGMVIVDVGAHIGLYTLYALRALNGAGKVFAFEPSPRTMSILRDNIQVNGYLEPGMAQLFPLAVSAQSGDAELSIIQNNSGHNTLFGSNLASEKLPIQTTTLDEALASEPRVDIVKIDAEGAEPFILQGMPLLRKRNPGLRIFIEFAPEHLRRAGVDPLQWAGQILMSYTVRRLHDATGELIQVTADELAGCISWNLLLTPATASS
jgi:FkbM family methyltransferase